MYKLYIGINLTKSYLETFILKVAIGSGTWGLPDFLSLCLSLIVIVTLLFCYPQHSDAYTEPLPVSDLPSAVCNMNCCLPI